MELIPILSTIILVATISTFILAVGAYILYKLQEKRADQYVTKELKPDLAEIVEPDDFGRRELVIEKPEEQPVFVKRRYQPVQTIVKEEMLNRRSQEKERTIIKSESSKPKFMKYTSDGYVVTKDDQNTGVINWR
jgi:hypothetical protein